ncbi:MAG: hypothetical protein JWO40_756 [Candidatus Doudnabacteria bacterium]|nr:hypothetical protein [Candidatus Doudnabacteria bacterium]
MKKLFLIICILLSSVPLLSKAQDNQSVGNIPLEVVEPGAVVPQSFQKAKVLEITKDERWNSEITHSSQTIPAREQDSKLQILDGPEKDKVINYRINENPDTYKQWLVKGEIVVVTKNMNQGQTEYAVVDRYRLPALGIMIVIFLAVVIFFGRLRGFTSILGLVFTIFILLKFIVPSILHGSNPLLVTLIGSIVISVGSIYLAHGFNKRISIAVLSTLITLVISIGMAALFVHLAKLFGLGSEEAYYLQAGYGSVLNLQGLLLSGIIIGTLGVLDDVTTSQVASVDEIRKVHPQIEKKRLYQGGISVGKEHIASLVNTLVLAYAGASLPLFLLFVLNTAQPLWVTLNSEFVMEEIVRTLVGSISLILAVPISTVLAVTFLTRMKHDPNDKPLHNHPH